MEIIAKDRLEAEDVRDLCERLLGEHLTLETEGYKISTRMALNVLMTAAVEQRSIEAVCGDLVEVVDSNTLREALNRALTVDDLRQQEAEFNAALVECIPRHLPRVGLQSTFMTSRITAKAKRCRRTPVAGKPMTGRPTFGELPRYT